MGWIVFLPFLVLWIVWNKRINKGGGGFGGGGKSKDIIAGVTIALAFITGTGLAFTFLGRWIATVVSWAGSGLASATGEAGLATAVPVAFSIFLLATVAFDVGKDRVADKGAQYAAMFLPVALALVAGGQMGQTGGGAVQAVYGQMSAFITVFGGS